MNLSSTESMKRSWSSNPGRAYGNISVMKVSFLLRIDVYITDVAVWEICGLKLRVKENGSQQVNGMP